MKRADGALLLLLGLLGVAFSHAQLDRPNNGTGPIAPILNLTVPIFNTSYFMNITSTKLATTAIKAVIVSRTVKRPTISCKHVRFMADGPPYLPCLHVCRPSLRPAGLSTSVSFLARGTSQPR